MKELINKYLDDHKLAWASSTLKSEKARLMAVADYLDGNPERLWKAIEGKGAYTRVTIWTRVIDFWDWQKQGANPYRTWREQHARLFKNTYQRKTPAFSFEEASKLLAKIKDPAIKRKARELLSGGLRFTESFTLSDKHVVGKGSKLREVFVPVVEGPEFKGSYWEFWRSLKSATGLKPHDLRKIRATSLLRKGMDLPSLCNVMGWSNLNTASSYLAPLKRKELEEFFK